LSSFPFPFPFHFVHLSSLTNQPNRFHSTINTIAGAQTLRVVANDTISDAAGVVIVAVSHNVLSFVFGNVGREVHWGVSEGNGKDVGMGRRGGIVRAL
jgi:hypothetical protein